MSPPGKILVVDDNEATRLLAQNTLEDEGYAVVLAPSGNEGIAAFEGEQPDCVVLDVRMPDLDGFAVCQRLRALPHGGETPVLFLTGLRDIETFDRALDIGGDDFLTKPVRPSELVARVKSAIELRRTRAELREHYVLLKKQRDDMMRLQLQKERLTAFVVHDLKNPVNALDLRAQLLLREKSLSPGARDSVQQIRAEARQLTRMIMNLLDLSRADEGQLAPHRTTIDLEHLATEILAELGVTANARGLRLEEEIEAKTVSADEDLLRRAVTNLVENAIKYAPAASSVWLTTRVHENAVELRVIDAGKGIPLELREKVFDPFVQVESGEVSRTSRGLGLSFCKSAIEAQGGKIWVEDGAPGTVFCVSLPR